MKGIIFNLVEEVVRNRYGEDTWDELLDAAGLDGAYTSLGSYPDEELLRLVAAAAHRRTGIGTRLVEAGVEAVRAAGARAAMLEVGYTNEPAIALYQRLGFEQLRVRESYYGPGQHALILKRYQL